MPGPDLVEFGQRSFKFVIEEPQDTWAYSADFAKKKLIGLVGAALLCGAVHAEPILNVKAAEMHEGDTACIVYNSKKI